MLNRAELFARIEAAGAARGDGSRPLGLVLLRVDHINQLGPSLGYAAVDEAVALIAARIHAALRPGDSVLPTAEGEFAVLLPDLRSRNHALLAAARLVRDFERPLQLSEGPVMLRASAGAAAWPDDAADADGLCRCAQLACDAAPRAAGRIAIYEPRARDARLDHGELHQAIVGNTLEVYLQPVIELTSGRVAGAESLARWTSPTRGIVSPELFITLAERTGLIGDLTRWSINNTLRLCSEVAGGDARPTFAINLSPHVLAEAGATEMLTGALSFWNVSPSSVVMEVTETALMEEPERGLEVLSRLRDRGIGIAIDDFGVGYSSLSYLKRFPATELKIDRSFVRDIATDHRSAQMVRSMIDLAHHLGLAVVAEGVEDEATLERLRDMGCDFAQGFHIARPAPAAAVLAFMARDGSTAPEALRA